MGQVYKNISKKEEFIMPNAKVLPLDKFDQVLNDATLLVSAQQYDQALPLLLNLEVTNFNHIGVHELLADVFLQLNQITLAKEQCQIYAQLLQQQNILGLPNIKSFDELVSEAGDFDELKKEIETFKTQELSSENFYYGTNITLKFATLLMAENRYKEAENILIEHRNRYLNFLDNTKS